MQASKTVSLGEGKDVVVHEMRVRDVRAAIDALPDEISGLSMRELIGKHLPNVLELLKPCIALPAGTTIDDLSLSEARQVGRAFMEVNPDFFALVESLIGQFGKILEQQLIKLSVAVMPSIGPLAPSSEPATSAPSTTATPSS